MPADRPQRRVGVRFLAEYAANPDRAARYGNEPWNPEGAAAGEEAHRRLGRGRGLGPSFWLFRLPLSLVALPFLLLGALVSLVGGLWRAATMALGLVLFLIFAGGALYVLFWALELG